MNQTRRIALFFISSLFALSALVLYPPQIENDSLFMISQTRNQIECLKTKPLSQCQNPEPYPLLQHIPAVFGIEVGMSDQRVGRFLAYLNIVFFILTSLLIWQSLAKNSSVAAYAAILILNTSYFVWYSRTSFGEMFAALMTLALIRSISDRWPLWISCIMFVFAGMTKEIAFFPLLVLCFSADQTKEPSLRYKTCGKLALFALPILAILTTAFNYVRFKTILNTSYLTPLFIVPDFAKQLNFLLALWLSPSSGLLFHFPFFIFLLLWLSYEVFTGKIRQKTPILGCLFVLGFLSVGFSKWYAPAGGLCWGPRFYIPWIPAIIYLLFRQYSTELSRLITDISQRKSAQRAFKIALVLVSWPHYRLIFRLEYLVNMFSGACEKPAIIQENVDYYYYCLNRFFWSARPAYLDLYSIRGFFGSDWLPTLMYICAIWLGSTLLFSGVQQKR